MALTHIVSPLVCGIISTNQQFFKWSHLISPYLTSSFLIEHMEVRHSLLYNKLLVLLCSVNESNTKARLALFNWIFKVVAISQNTGKCELGGFSLRQSLYQFIRYLTKIQSGWDHHFNNTLGMHNSYIQERRKVVNSRGAN